MFENLKKVQILAKQNKIYLENICKSFNYIVNLIKN